MLESFKKNGFSISNQDNFIFENSNMILLLENSNFDDSYVEYVKNYNYSSEYLKYVENVITIINDVVFPLIEADVLMKGKCTQICDFISYLLCKLKVNSFQQYGTLLIEFSNSVKQFSHVSTGRRNITLGHYWIFVPPFKILDLSVGQQEYSQREKKYIYGSVVKKNDGDELLNSKFLSDSRLDLLNNFGVYVESHNKTKMHYFVKKRFVQLCKIDDDLDKICTDNKGINFTINNKSPSDILTKVKEKIEEK